MEVTQDHGAALAPCWRARQAPGTAPPVFVPAALMVSFPDHGEKSPASPQLGAELGAELSLKSPEQIVGVGDEELSVTQLCSLGPEPLCALG